MKLILSPKGLKKSRKKLNSQHIQSSSVPPIYKGKTPIQQDSMNQENILIVTPWMKTRHTLEEFRAWSTWKPWNIVGCFVLKKEPRVRTIMHRKYKYMHKSNILPESSHT